MFADMAGDILGPHQGAWVGSVQLRDLRHSPGVCPAPLMTVPTTVHTGGPEAESAGPDFTPVTTGRSECGHMARSSSIQHRTPHTRPLEATSVLPVESLRVLLNNTFLSLQAEQVLGFECVLLKDRGVYVRERDREGDRDREGAIQARPAQDAPAWCPRDSECPRELLQLNFTGFPEKGQRAAPPSPHTWLGDSAHEDTPSGRQCLPGRTRRDRPGDAVSPCGG